LAGAAVLINGSRVPVLAASPTEVTFKCPNGPGGGILNVELETAAGRSGVLKTALRESTLAALTVHGPRGHQAAATVSDSDLAMPRNYGYAGFPAQPGDLLKIPATGFSGDPDWASLTILIGDIATAARSATTIPGTTGIFHIGIVIPASAPIGDAVPLRIQQHLPDGHVITSPVASIAIEAIRQ